jgi:hypothetical protein
MHKISFLVVAAALVLTAGVGSWTALTTTDVKAAAKATNMDSGGRTPIRGGHFVMQSVF